MQDAKNVSTPITHLKLQKSSTCDANIPYRVLIGSLMFLAVNTRPDIAFAVSYLKPIPFSPQDIRPLPQAGPRSETKRGEEYNQRNKAKKPIFQTTPGKGKKKLPSAKGKGQGKKTRNPNGSKGKENLSTENSSEGEDYFCLICLELFSNSLPKEKWMQCLDCKKWSNAVCTTYSDTSSDIGCAFVSNMSDKYYVWPIPDIKYKCQKIPFQNKRAVFPLLHGSGGN
ncbi:hypothetical protein ILUMI_23654 [Ignelater luminosus]|uniref:Uncharacterized protein n=1 Tax=Ignelater luminosus TaxID=2038154 RepID=A0A8K0C8E1_IGNLU|nr:hypothetical protein ILUMI_23654 [Ignelater luminosus]